MTTGTPQVGELQTNAPSDREIVLQVTNLKKYFPVTKGILITKIMGQLKAVGWHHHRPPAR